MLSAQFDACEAACRLLLTDKLVLPAYEQMVKASHAFNLLDARHAVSVTERQRFILRVRTLARGRRRGLSRQPRSAGVSAAQEQRSTSGLMSTKDLLFELRTEELPPRTLLALSNALSEGMVKGFDAAAVSHGKVHGFATPRRLAVWIEKLAENQPDRQVERRGPPIANAFDAQGAATQAATAFAKSCGVAVGGAVEAHHRKRLLAAISRHRARRGYHGTAAKRFYCKPSPPCRYLNGCAGAHTAPSS